MHKGRSLRLLTVISAVLLAAVFVTGCTGKKNASDVNIGTGSDAPDAHVHLKGKVEFDGKPVNMGYILFTSMPGGAAMPGEEQNQDAHRTNQFAYGFATINGGEYEAFRVPIGMVRVTIYTNPVDFDEDLNSCKTKTKNQHNNMGMGHGRRGGPQDPTSRAGDDTDLGPGGPPVGRNERPGDPTDGATRFQGGDHKESFQGAGGGMPPGKQSHFDPADQYRPGGQRGSQNPDRAEGPDPDKLAKDKMRWSKMEDSMKAELSKPNNKGKNYKIVKNQTELDIAFGANEGGSKTETTPGAGGK